MNSVLSDIIKWFKNAEYTILGVFKFNKRKKAGKSMCTKDDFTISDRVCIVLLAILCIYVVLASVIGSKVILKWLFV